MFFFAYYIFLLIVLLNVIILRLFHRANNKSTTDTKETGKTRKSIYFDLVCLSTYFLLDFPLGNKPTYLENSLLIGKLLTILIWIKYRDTIANNSSWLGKELSLGVKKTIWTLAILGSFCLIYSLLMDGSLNDPLWILVVGLLVFLYAITGIKIFTNHE